MKYKITLLNNFISVTYNGKIYNLEDIENDIGVESFTNEDKYSVFNTYFFILTEEQSIYFKMKYIDFIFSITAIEDDACIK